MLAYDGLNVWVLVGILLGVPFVYLAVSYGHVACWHGKLLLWNTVIHENGRLTLRGSVFYWDHFLGCLPMVVLFSLCAAGGVAVAGNPAAHVDAMRAVTTAAVLLGASAGLVPLAVVASVNTAGWQRTVDYALQRIERDGIRSRGGNWNQLQLSNVPVALGTAGLGSALVVRPAGSEVEVGLIQWGFVTLGTAALGSIGLTAANWCGLRRFLTPRWLAHSFREVATYPFTGIPVAFASVVLVEWWIAGSDSWSVRMGPVSMTLIGLGVAMTALQLIPLAGTSVLALAQRPAFARDGLSVAYLLASHVFEHVLDFVMLALLPGGLYGLLRVLAHG